MSNTPDPSAGFAAESAQLREAILALESRRSLLGDMVVDAALGPMRERLSVLDAAQRPTQQRKIATILFADVVGFTALSEMRDPEIVAQGMNDLWARVDTAILAHGGKIDKHIGDAVMAVWGADVAREEDAEQAVRAALAMQAGADHCCNLFNIPITLRIGIHTGHVLAGHVGTGEETTVLGDTVNLASRIESAAPPGGILISHATYRHIRGVFDVQFREPIAVKGIADRVVVYRVLRAKPRAFRLGTRGVEGIETRMVGRDNELHTLQDAFTSVLTERRPRVVIVAGEAGVGKSRLLYEFDNWLELHPVEVVYYKARASPNLRGVAFSLFRDLFSNRFDILDSDTSETALQKFRAGFMSVIGVRDSNEESVADIVGQWLGFDFDASPVVTRLLGSPEFGLIAQTHLLRYFRACINSDPLVLFLEDIHWADDPSLDLVSVLIDDFMSQDQDGQAPVLIVCLTRPILFERRPDWQISRSGFERLPLKLLSRRNTLELVDEILQKVDQLPPRLRERIADSSDGNPFYIEELVKMLIEQGVIVRGDRSGALGSNEWHSWYVKSERIDSFPIPLTLAGLVQAGLDGLPIEERRSLQHAAVIGREFWDDAVAFLAGENDVSGIKKALQATRERELIFHRDRSVFSGTEEYIFKHAVLRDVTYETVLLRDRRGLHARFAEWLEVHAGERLDEYLGLLATHLIEAGEDNRAATYLERSGRLALAAGNHSAARTALQQAADLNDPSPGLLVSLGEACFMLSDYPAAKAVLERALKNARSVNDNSIAVDCLYWLSRTETARGDFAIAAEYLNSALPIARAVGGSQLARALEGLAGSAGSRGDLDAAERYAKESLELARTNGDLVLEMRVLTLLGTFARLRGDLDTAEAQFTAGYQLARSAGNLEREATALINLGDLAYRRRRYELARDHARSALTLFRDQGQWDAVAVAGGNLAQAELMLGSPEAAATEARRALVAARDSGATPLMLFAMAVFGHVSATLGEANFGRALLRLVRDHPATEFQDRQEAESLLAALGPDDGPPVDLDFDSAVAAILENNS